MKEVAISSCLRENCYLLSEKDLTKSYIRLLSYQESTNRFNLKRVNFVRVNLKKKVKIFS